MWGFSCFLRKTIDFGYPAFASDDIFAWDGDDSLGSLDSQWANLVSSLSWAWLRNRRVTVDATAYHSGYGKTQENARVGGSDALRKRWITLRRQSLYPPELRGLLELTGIRRPMSVIYVCQLEAERPPRYSSMAFLSRSSSGLW